MGPKRLIEGLVKVYFEKIKQKQVNKKRDHNDDCYLLSDSYMNSSRRWVRAGWLDTNFLPRSH